MQTRLALLLVLAACTPASPPMPSSSPLAPTSAPSPTVAAPDADAVPSPPPGPSPTLARIAGRITYPSEALPAMRVCALDSADPAQAVCVFTAPNQAEFAMDLPPGRWWLLAWPTDAGIAGDPGVVSAASACLAAGEMGCDEHALLAIDLAPGEHRDGLEINDWYYDPAAYPPPAPPRDGTAD